MNKNYDLMDIFQAVMWINVNISSFGAFECYE